MTDDQQVVVVTVIPQVEGWDQEKGLFVLTFLGHEDGSGIETYPANNIPTHGPDIEIPVLPELEALRYCFENITKPAAIPVEGLSEQLRLRLGLA